MNKIHFPLEPRMKGPEVGDLQDALELLLDRGVILRDDEGWALRCSPERMMAG